jgi:hypothetical protein
LADYPRNSWTKWEMRVNQSEEKPGIGGGAVDEWEKK